MELDPFKLQRTQEALATLGLDHALFTDFYNVSYLTGYTQFFENGPSPFTRGAAAAFFAPQTVWLVAEGLPIEEMSIEGWQGRSLPFQGYGYDRPTPPLENYVQAVLEAAQALLPNKGKVGIEAAHLPLSLYEPLQALRPNLQWVPLDPQVLLNVRAIKSPTELEKLRVCARLCEVGQEAVRALIQTPGKSEIEIYAQAKAVMEGHVKGRFALQNALHAGLNSQSPFPGMPSDYVTQAGDLLISDMVPYYNGYWGDSCSSYVVGGAIQAEQRFMHQLALEAFEMGFEASRVGAVAGDIDALVRGHLAKHGYTYPHHTGHGLGVSNHEEPRLIIGGSTRLAAGMVVAIEPPVYKAGFGGLRLERMYLITASGPQLLAHNSFELF